MDNSGQDCFVVSGVAARQVRSVSGLCRSVSGGAVRPLDALRRRTHLSGRLNSHRLTRHRQDRLVVSGGRCESSITGSTCSGQFSLCAMNVPSDHVRRSLQTRHRRVVHGSILCDPIQPNPPADPTQPTATNNGANICSLAVTYFYTQI